MNSESQHAASVMGIVVLIEQDEAAQCRLEIEARHLNRQGVCHGGVIFTLADTAMALASNGGEKVAVASHASINFLEACNLGDVLTATAEFVAGSGKSRLYDIRVEKSAGVVVAEFRGTTITVK